MYRILIIEDDRGIAEAINEQAGMWGLEAENVRNFRNVMAEFSEFDPHLILLDISLPFFNGYHWCSEIRKVSKVPIIFISSASDNMNIVMAMNMGGDDFITKPFDQSVLMEHKEKVVSREKLMEVLWDSDSFVDENTLTVNVGRLRKKLEAAGLTDFISTKFGAGYIIKD